MADCAIRRALARDLDALIALEARFPCDRLSRASLRRFVNGPSAEVWVADCEGTVTGDAVILYRRNAPRARLYSLVVDGARTGRGIGRALLRACEKAARARGCRELVLEVRPDNAPAIALYERAGFRLATRLEAFYEDGAAALRFTKSLPGAPGGSPEPTLEPLGIYA